MKYDILNTIMKQDILPAGAEPSTFSSFSGRRKAGYIIPQRKSGRLY